MATPTRHDKPGTLPSTPLVATTVPPSATKSPRPFNPYRDRAGDSNFDPAQAPSTSNKQPTLYSPPTMATPTRPRQPGTLLASPMVATTVPPSASKAPHPFNPYRDRAGDSNFDPAQAPRNKQPTTQYCPSTTATPTRHRPPSTLLNSPLIATTVPPSATKAPHPFNPYRDRAGDSNFDPLVATTVPPSATKAPSTISHKRKNITRASLEETKSPIKKQPTSANPKSKKKARSRATSPKLTISSSTPFERFNAVIHNTKSVVINSSTIHGWIRECFHDSSLPVIKLKTTSIICATSNAIKAARNGFPSTLPCKSVRRLLHKTRKYQTLLL
jgi:hypothetical protein